jgi:NRPS condensation-like uncharacterized protein
MILQSKYYALGANLYSGELTNLGKVDLTPDINDRIDAFLFIPPPPNKALKVDCGFIGFKDRLMMTFGNITTSNAFEERFLAVMREQGIPYDEKKLENFYNHDQV